MGWVELSNVSKSFGALRVIHDLSLDIAEGEFLALVGPSGCGKSTLLRMIAGLEEVSGGTIAIGGEEVTGLSPRDRDIAMVFQSYALYPHMTVAQNMGFNLKLRGMSKDQQRPIIAEAARMLDLAELLERRPAQLSGGQRQRVAMGRAVVRSPSVFLFDEPLSNLDAKLRVQMRGEIKVLHQKVQRTSVYVTHDQIEAMTLSDRIVVLNAGRIEQVGRPMDLYNQPGNVFVAGFIGSPAMNFLPATITSDADKPAASLPDGTVIPLHPRIDARPAQAVTIGIRPEHFSLAAADRPAMLRGPVRLVEPTGAQTHVIFALAGQDTTVVIDSAAAGAIGDTISVAAAPDLVHVFDRETDVRLPLRASN